MLDVVYIGGAVDAGLDPSRRERHVFRVDA